MQPFEFISVFVSIIISFALAHLLNGIAHIIENGYTRFSFLLAHWVGFCFALCIGYWFAIWQTREQADWTFVYVGLVLLQGSLIYIASRLVVPAPSNDDPIDLSAFFDRHRRKFMGVIAAGAIVNVVTHLALRGFAPTLLGAMVVLWVLLALIGFLWSAKPVQYAVASANIALSAWYATTFIVAL
ncbi:MAG TPA: hypothetical protein PLN53_04055 [Terricaulis sp.]|nr:hypothetical protein [Terricaulis sp.]